MKLSLLSSKDSFLFGFLSGESVCETMGVLGRMLDAMCIKGKMDRVSITLHQGRQL